MGTREERDTQTRGRRREDTHQGKLGMMRVPIAGMRMRFPTKVQRSSRGTRRREDTHRGKLGMMRVPMAPACPNGLSTNTP